MTTLRRSCGKDGPEGEKEDDNIEKMKRSRGKDQLERKLATVKR
jgi:hypothetical protein